MSRRLISVLAVAVAGLAGAAFLLRPTHADVPQPAIVPISWQIDFKHEGIERLTVKVDGKEQAYWYMRYTVTNNSGQDLLFTPFFEIVGDTGAAVNAFKDANGKEISNDVFKKIKELYNNPLLLSPTAIYGKLLQGDDNAKDGVIIFTNLDPNARTFRLYVSGLSGETATVENPVTHEKVILHKTLELTYNIPGEAIGIEPHSILRDTRWIMK